MHNKSHYILGKRGEEAACAYLVEEGYQILATNYVTPWGEIDIIAREGKALCFIEVKTRANTACGFPAEAIDTQKRKKMSVVARSYVDAIRPKYKEYRFDVVEIIYGYDRDDCAEIILLKDAFTLDDFER